MYPWRRTEGQADKCLKSTRFLDGSIKFSRTNYANDLLQFYKKIENLTQNTANYKKNLQVGLKIRK